jgi:hypothetical protein
VDTRRSFTLRFENPETHRLLALVARRLGVSMNLLAEQMITNDLGVVSLGLQEDLLRALAALSEPGRLPTKCSVCLRPRVAYRPDEV